MFAPMDTARATRDRWEVARVWRLGRQVSYVIVSAQLKLRPARQLGHRGIPAGCATCASVELSIAWSGG